VCCVVVGLISLALGPNHMTATLRFCREAKDTRSIELKIQIALFNAMAAATDPRLKGEQCMKSTT
jgi:hypothetical protein